MAMVCDRNQQWQQIVRTGLYNRVIGEKSEFLPV
jgi:hypothetical protein